MTAGKESPAAMYVRTGGGDAYRVAMLEAGYVLVNSLRRAA